MINLGEEQLNPSNNGPAGGIPSKPVLRAPVSAYRRVQLVPSAVLTGTTFPNSFERSSITNVTVQRFCTTPATPAGQPVSCPAGTRPDLERSDISRFKSVANATDRVARGQVSAANVGNSVQCDAGTCRFQVVPGQSYRAGASLEVETINSGAFRAAVVWYDAGGAAISESEIQSLSAVTARTRFQPTVTAPANAARGAVKFEWTGAAAEGTAYADALTLVPSNVSGTLKDNPGEWGAQRIIDFSQNPPTTVGTYRSPSSSVYPPPPGQGPAGDPPAFYEPRAARMFSSNIMLTTWMSDGLRVVDVSNPTVPREIGSFVPPPVADPSPEAGAGSTNAPPRTDSPSLELRRGRSWPTRTLVTGVDILKREGSTGTVVISDINGGIYVLNLALRAAEPGPGTYTVPPGPPPGARTCAAQVATGRSLRSSRRGLVRLRLRGPASATAGCRGRVSITTVRRFRTRRRGRAVRVRLGSAAYNIRRRQTKLVRVRISRTGRRLLARRQRLKVRITARSADRRAVPATRRRSVTLLAPRKPRKARNPRRRR